MRERERLTKAAKLHHGGNPLLRFAIDHLVVDIDSNGDPRPAKSRAKEKIDPAVSLLMALDLAIREPVERESEHMLFFVGGTRR